MNTGRWAFAGAMTALITLGSGCVGLDKHRQLETANRSLAAAKTQLESELYDCRTNNENLRTRLAGAEGQLRDKDLLVANLQSENDQLEKAFSTCQQTVDKLAARGLSTDMLAAKLPEELDTALRDFARKYPDTVEYDPHRGFVKWKADLLFAFGSDVVRDSSLASLEGFAEIMTSPAAAGFDILVVGHTDDRPMAPATKKHHPDNWYLSVHRGITVTSVLMGDGVSPKKIGVAGFGEFRPVVPGPSKYGVGEPRNRRVEIYVVPAGSIGGTAAREPASAETTTPAARQPEAPDVVK